MCFYLIFLVFFKLVFLKIACVDFPDIIDFFQILVNCINLSHNTTITEPIVYISIDNFISFIANLLISQHNRLYLAIKVPFHFLLDPLPFISILSITNIIIILLIIVFLQIYFSLCPYRNPSTFLQLFRISINIMFITNVKMVTTTSYFQNRILCLYLSINLHINIPKPNPIITNYHQPMVIHNPFLILLIYPILPNLFISLLHKIIRCFSINEPNHPIHQYDHFIFLMIIFH